MTPTEFVAQARAVMEPRRDAEKAAPMARYMKDLFPFLGLPRPEFAPLAKPLLAGLKGKGGKVSEAWLGEAAQALWGLPEREYQYLVLALLQTHAKTLTPASLPLLQALVQGKSWWDTVDALASHPVGSVVLRHPEARAEMDRWSRHPDFWVRRTAILHQLGHKARTDRERLFDYCLHNAPDKEFFIRKAIGWALREYAKTEPEDVYAFVDQHRAALSPLSLREASKHRKNADGL